MATLGFLFSFLKSQLFFVPPVPTKKFTGQTIIITGSNTGIGLKAARHFAQLGAAKVILAVRSLAKGEAAVADIERTTGQHHGVVEAWVLDLAHYDSVYVFAARAQKLGRIDVLVQNAGVLLYDFSPAGNNEATIAVNVISPILLSLLLLPKLRETATRFDKEVVLTFTGSFRHATGSFPERTAEHIFQGLADPKRWTNGDARYEASKMIQLLLTTELAGRVLNSKNLGSKQVTISTVNPGWVQTDMMRNAPTFYRLGSLYLGKLLSRTPEQGGRIIVAAAEGGFDTHGQYLDDCKPRPDRVKPWVFTQDGELTKTKLWNELSEVLEKIQPGILRNI